MRKALVNKKAARIANSPDSGKKGGSSEKYERWTKEDLYEKAKQVGIDGRSNISKKELIDALRNN